MGYTPRVLIIGGGAVGTAVARDLAMRGLDVTLVERGSLAAGATGRSGGLLDSGARVAVADPERGADYYAENQRLRDIASHCVEETGGLYTGDTDDSDRLDRLSEACENAGIPAELADSDDVADLEPRLSGERGLFVPDARIDPFRLTVATAASAREFGATIETRTAVTDILLDDAVRGVEILREGEAGPVEMRTDYVVNAAGPWTGRVAGMAGLDVPVAYATGTLAIANDRPTETVVHGPQLSDGGRIVPFGRRSVLARTDGEVDDPNTAGEGPDIEGLLEAVSELLPGLTESRLLRGFCQVGAVPRSGSDVDQPRVPGGFEVFDHETRDGLWGISTVVGGTVTSHRLVAETVADHVCGKFGIDRPCQTAEYPLPGSESGPGVETIAHEFDLDTTVASRCIDRQGSRTRDALSATHPNPIVCACESVTRAEVRDAIDSTDSPDIDAVRVRTGAGMGECQGGRCCHRVGTEFYPASDHSSVVEAVDEFYRSRWTGQRHALWGDQLQEAMRTYAVHATTMNRGTEPRQLDIGAYEGGAYEHGTPGEGGKIP